jgi:hypothetical protein
MPGFNALMLRAAESGVSKHEGEASNEPQVSSSFETRASLAPRDEETFDDLVGK